MAVEEIRDVVMATFINSLTPLPDNTIEISAQITSACCNTTYIYQQSKDGIISREGIQVDEGTRTSLENAIRYFRLIRNL